MRLGCPSHIGTGTFIAGCQPGRDRAGEGLRCIFRLFWAGLAACDFSGRTRRERVALATGRGKATGFMGPYVPWSYICNLFDTPSWAWEVSTVVFFFFLEKNAFQRLSRKKILMYAHSSWEDSLVSTHWMPPRDPRNCWLDFKDGEG